MRKFSAYMFAFIIGISIIPNVYAYDVTVSGECVGVKIYTDGLIVTDTVTLTQTDGKTVDVSSKYGIKKGDIIKKVNGVDAISVKTITSAIEDGDNLTLTVEQNGKTNDVTITPVCTKDGRKLGLWLRDSTAGMGTITCYTDDKFYALGHGICDIDTGNIMPVKNGIIQKCSDIEISKGKIGIPGAIYGIINGDECGNIEKNGEYGISGTVKNVKEGIVMPAAEPREIKRGSAKILADVDGSGVKEYDVKINNITFSKTGTKNMVVEVTDKSLIEKTGGIVQGMSGAPIVQNEKLVGAITHVFVNDPTRGYGIFIENMLDKAS